MTPNDAKPDDTPDSYTRRGQYGRNVLPGTSFVLTAVASDEQRNCLERTVLRQRTLANLGVSDQQDISPRLEGQIEEAIDRVLEAAEPDFLCRAYPMDPSEGPIRVGSHVTFNSKALSTGLGWCNQAVAYVATLGPRVDTVIDEAMADRRGLGLIVDTVASEAVEFLVDEIEQTVSDWLMPHEAISLPFSPGYCDWPVDEQAKLFSLLPEEPLDISLLPTCLMTPRKTIAGLLGIGLTARINDTCNPCKSCPQKCEHRRHRRSFTA